MENKKIKNLIWTIALTFQLLTVSAFAQNKCADVHLITQKVRAQVEQRPPVILPERAETTKELIRFAEEFNLPSKWLEVGPPERKIKRLFVAIDISRPEVVQAYRERFNLETKVGDSGAGTLVLEYGRESSRQEHKGHYVPAIFRRWADSKKPGYRWGKPDPYIKSYEEYFQSWILGKDKNPDYEQTGIGGFTHLIELNAKEKDNVERFLEHPEERGPCKSDNCVAWQAGIELGTTNKNATDAERRYLFNELGVSRAMAHFELGRRLLHAANERHSAIGVFVNGAKGLKNFEQALEKHLVPDPQVPYASILKGYVATSSPALKALEAIPDGAKVFMPIAAGASPEAVGALVARASNKDTQKGFDLHVLVNGVSSTEFKKGVETADGKFRLHALFLGGNLRQLNNEGKVNVIPGNLSDFTRIMRDPTQTQFHYDAIVVRVSEKTDADGFHSLGPNHDMIMTIIKNRPGIRIIAEVNPNIPFTKGDNRIHKDQITASFKSATELAGPAVVPPSVVDSTIGDYIGQLVPSAATLQIGIGNVFSGVPTGLKRHGRNKINISTEMFGDAMMQMMNEPGMVANAETGFAYGSSSLYRWLDGNQKLEFRSTEQVNDPGRVSQIDNFHAVNTAIQVDLFGQSNATMGPNGRISSPGGQVEFMSGAARSKGGKAIIAIRSTAKEGAVSTITMNLYQGAITTPHESVTHVVTEYGVAQLQGKSEKERAIALINIAHPKFRQQLFREAMQHPNLKNKITENDLVLINLNQPAIGG